MTPTGSSPGNLDPARISKLDDDGATVRPRATHSVAVSRLPSIPYYRPGDKALEEIARLYPRRRGRIIRASRPRSGLPIRRGALRPIEGTPDAESRREYRPRGATLDGLGWAAPHGIGGGV